MAMVTGSGPQSKVTAPPAATASTTAALVHVSGVPFPTTPERFRPGSDPGVSAAIDGGGGAAAGGVVPDDVGLDDSVLDDSVLDDSVFDGPVFDRPPPVEVSEPIRP